MRLIDADELRKVVAIKTTIEIINKTKREEGGSAIEAAKELRRYCRERGPACKGCPFVLDSPSNLCTLKADLPEDWKLEFMEGDG